MLGETSLGQISRGTLQPFFPGLLLFRKLSKTQGKQPAIKKRRMVENNEESTPFQAPGVYHPTAALPSNRHGTTWAHR